MALYLDVLLLLAQDDPGRGDDPGGGVGVLIIVGIIVLVLALGVLLAKKVFVRGSMPSKPEEDPGVRSGRRRP